MTDRTGPLGNRLTRARATRGWTQQELATRSGIAAGQISRYESGLSQPRAEVLAKLAATLDVEFTWLQHGIEAGAGDDLASWRISVSLPQSLHKAIAAAAEASGHSIAHEVKARLAASFDPAQSGDNEELMRRISFLEGCVEGSKFTTTWVATESNAIISELHQFAQAMKVHTGALEEVVHDALDELDSLAQSDSPIPTERLEEFAGDLRSRFFQLEYDGHELKVPDLRQLNPTRASVDNHLDLPDPLGQSEAEKRTAHADFLPGPVDNSQLPKSVPDTAAAPPKRRVQRGAGRK